MQKTGSPIAPGAPVGVVVVTHNSQDVVGECLDSLLAPAWPDLRVVVSDNASRDRTVAAVRASAMRACVPVTAAPQSGPAGHSVTILRNRRNRGFAAGVNAALAHLHACPEIGLFWILNPDCRVLPGTAMAYLRGAREAGRFGLIGGRTFYHAPDRTIQSDGGRVGRWSGICRNANQGCRPADAVVPLPETLDYVSGANFAVSRAFLDRAGAMPEDYFLYYEEVEWAMRRGDLPLVICPNAAVLHHCGTSAGSGIPGRTPSAFSNYFNYRNRMRFMRRQRPIALPTSWALSMARIARLGARGAWAAAWGAFCGLNGLAPPPAVRARLALDAEGTASRPVGVDQVRQPLTD